MSKIKPFRAVRPVRDKVHLVASRSYVTYNERKLREKLESNPFSFIHIIYPDFAREDKTRRGSRAQFSRVKERYEEFLADGTLIREAEDAIYIYRQSSPDRSSIGIITGVSAQEYLDGRIKVHEQTLSKREKLFTDYLNTTQFNAEPVLLSYHDPNDFDSKLSDYTSDHRAEYDFTTTDRVRHELWPITDPSLIEKYQTFFDSLPELYIADGHHRSASSAKLAQMRAKGESLELTPAGYFMAYVLSNRQLNILNFNRLIRDLGDKNSEQIVQQLAQVCDVEVLADASEPRGLHEFTMFMGENWYRFKLKPVNDNSPLAQLDPQLLYEQVLATIFGIDDPRTDRRIDYLPGDTGIKGIEQAVSKGVYQCGIILYPTPFEQLRAVADAGLTMPPKSTYVEPKLRSGLTIFELNK